MTSLLPTGTSVDARDRDVAVLPVGSFEQHGAFLPLATDSVIAMTVAGAVASAHPVLLLPPVTISCSHEHAAWPGTVSISAATLYAIVRDVADSLRLQGIRKLALVSGHGGNYVLGNVVQEASARGERMALFPTETDWLAARAAGGVETGPDTDMHAGELETSLLLHAHPELVPEDYADHDERADERDRFLTLGLGAYTRSGVIGRPSLATPAKGRDALAYLVTAFGDVLAALNH
ncbi:creatininase family protein [Actinophytocola oryzae]|uniref:Creatinine amidohydrolase n=1 Tax=Actinophytocola oryzae TaxID=502181 RepID=A0A4R7V863_9PSEU|nr:creatininase family protein [Actinophytocola oryzae]TDV44745.1 creatinine amidohydrolase [Actinophytocola oryzae]